MRVRDAVCAALHCQLVGRPYSVTFGALWSEFSEIARNTTLLVWWSAPSQKERGICKRSFVSRRVCLKQEVLISLQSLRRKANLSRDVIFRVHRNSRFPHFLSSMTWGLWSCMKLLTSSRLFDGLSWVQRELIGGRYVSYDLSVGSIWDTAIDSTSYSQWRLLVAFWGEESCTRSLCASSVEVGLWMMVWTIWLCVPCLGKNEDTLAGLH